MADDPPPYNGDDALKKIAKYLANLGGYLGYDLTQSSTVKPGPATQQLINAPGMQLAQQYLFNSVLGAIPVNAFSNMLSSFVPNNFPEYSAINAFANYTFTSQPYNSPGDQQGKVAVSPLIDQQNYQQDPINQAILNILATPDYTYCMSYDASTWNSNCELLYQNAVMSNVLGPLPSTHDYFTYKYNQTFLSQLNSNSLIAPLLYATQGATSSTSSSPPNTKNQGLSAQNQAQEAANFIRYASGAVMPLSLPKLADYDQFYTQALNKDNSVSPIVQKQAQATLANYFMSLRVYAAQNSIGMSNLYHILSKRMPQNQGTSETHITSQAMSEFVMATWRLFNPDQSANKQWVNQINQASPDTIQKEMVTLLAEINYQLYLSRQQEERLLLTNTILLLQNSRASQPTNNLSNSEAQ